MLQTSDATNLGVLLTDSTDVGRVQGVFKARKKETSTAALIPGLAVKVEGNFNDQNRLVAESSSLRAMIRSGRKPSRLEPNRQMSHRIQETIHLLNGRKCGHSLMIVSGSGGDFTTLFPLMLCRSAGCRAEPLERIVGEALRRFAFCRCGASSLVARAPGCRPLSPLRVPGTGDLPPETCRPAWSPLYRLQVQDYGDSGPERRALRDQAGGSARDKDREIPARVQAG